MARNKTRTLTLLFFFVVFVGSVLPESGNLLAAWQGYQEHHRYNIYFLVGGILAVVICGVALYRRLHRDNTIEVVGR